MASYLTQVRPDQQYQSQIATEPIAFALASRQQRYDAEFAKVEAFAQSAANLDLAKDVDAAYYQNNLKYLLDEVSKGTGDLSLLGAGKIKSYIAQAADDKVVQGYIGTRELRAKEAEWEELKTKSPELYNQANYDFSMQNANSWLTDGKVGSSLNSYSNPYTGRGIGEVNPYVNTLDKANEVIKSIAPEGYVELTSSGDWEFFKKSGERLTDTKIIQTLETMLLADPQVSNQMRINSWDAYRGLDNSTFAESYKQIYAERAQEYDATISEIESQLAVTGNKNQREQLEQTLQYVKGKKNEEGNFIGGLTDEQIIQQRPSIENSLYTNQFLQNIANTFKYDNVKDVSIMTSQEQMAKWKDSQVQKRHNQTLMNDIVGQLNDYKIKYAELGSAGRVGEMTAVENVVSSLQAQLQNNFAKQLVEVYGVEQANKIAGVTAYSLLNEGAYVPTKADSDIERLDPETLTGIAYSRKTQNWAEVKDRTETYLRQIIPTDSKSYNLYFNKKGNLRDQMIDKIFSSNSSFITGNGLENIISPSVSKEEVISTLLSIKDTYTQYSILDNIISSHESNAVTVNTQELIDDFNNSAPFKGYSNITNSTAYYKRINAGKREGEGIFGSNDLDVIVMTDKDGNVIRDNGNLIVAKVKGDGGLFQQQDIKVSSVEQLATVLASQANKNISEGIARDYKNTFGDKAQAIEIPITGSGSQYAEVLDALSTVSNEEIRSKYGSVEALKTYTQGGTYKGEQINPILMSLGYDGATGMSYVNIDGVKYPTNPSKVPNSPYNSRINSIKNESNLKINSNITKKNDILEVYNPTNNKKPVLSSTPWSNISIVPDNSIVTDIKVKKIANGVNDVIYSPVIVVRDNTDGTELSKDFTNLQFNDIAAFNTFIQANSNYLTYEAQKLVIQSEQTQNQ